MLKFDFFRKKLNFGIAPGRPRSTPIKLVISLVGLIKLKTVQSLFSPVAMGLGAQTIMNWEIMSVGIQWSNVAKYTSPSAGTNFASIIAFLFADTILYYLLARYFDLIQQAEWGISYPWYYPFQKSFWRSLCRNRDRDNSNGNYNSGSGFSFSRVFKQFKRSKCCSLKGEYDLVIDNLSFDAPQDQITILLGHNGAGKSTVMKILSGIYDIDSGDVFVGGLSTENNMGSIRKSLGLCPQEGIKEHSVTVKEISVCNFLFISVDLYSSTIF